jgi:cytochrome c peroxidase
MTFPRSTSILLAIVGGYLLLTTAFSTTEPNSKEALGKMLFEEKLLSRDKTISCASCHIPALGFVDSTVISTGVFGRKGTRNTPSVMNIKFRPYFFYDGRAATLEEQVHFPVNHPDEMDYTLREGALRLNKVPSYRKYFKKIFGKLADSASIVEAIVSFEMTLETEDTEFDNWMQDRPNKMSESAKRGRKVFLDPKSKCFECHFSPDFTGDDFRNVGMYDGVTMKDVGRFAITKDSADLGKFKVPSLRNVGKTAPYMHNGVFKTLREVIDYYDDPKKFFPNVINRDTLFNAPLGLTEQEKVDLEQFLLSLNDNKVYK